MKNLPNFENAEWNAERQRLQEQLGQIAERLADHMVSPGGFRGHFEFDMVDGRTLHLTLETGPRPKPQ